MRIELPPETSVIFRDVPYTVCEGYDELIECRTPGNGCYRCTKLFGLHFNKGE